MGCRLVKGGCRERGDEQNMVRIHGLEVMHVVGLGGGAGWGWGCWGMPGTKIIVSSLWGDCKAL